MSPYLVGALCAPLIVAAGALAVWAVARAIEKAENAHRFARAWNVEPNSRQANLAAIVALTPGRVRVRRRILRRGYIIRTRDLPEPEAVVPLGAAILAEARKITQEDA